MLQSGRALRNGAGGKDAQGKVAAVAATLQRESGGPDSSFKEEEQIMEKQALKGIRVLDFTTMAAGPLASAMMADFGAEVIKVERPGRGDDGRKFPRMVDGGSVGFCWFNRGKKSLCVDLGTPEGVEVIRRLLPSVNVVLENFRPGVMKRLGLDYEAVKAIRPDIVYGSLTTYGQEGKFIQKPGYDIVAQAMSGLMSITGEADGDPQKSGAPLGDLIGGLNLYTSVLTALYHWRDTGEGQYVDVSLLRTLIYMNSPLNHCNFGEAAASRRQGNHHPTMAPYGLFKCRKGSVIIGAAGKSIWENLCTLMGREDLKTDPDYLEVTDRARNQKKLIPLIEQWLKDTYADSDEAQAALDAGGVPCAQVYDQWQVFNEPEFRKLGWIRQVPAMPGMEHMPTFWDRAGNCNMSETPPEFFRAPLLGEHTEELMKSVGYSQEEIGEVKARWTMK